MGSLDPFWQHLELHPHSAEVSSEWQRVLAGCFADAAEHLTATGEFASMVGSPLINAPDMRVVHYPDGTAGAVCDEGISPSMSLEPGDIALSTVSAKSLRSALARALGLRTSTVPTQGCCGELPLGAWEPQLETAFPVVMVAHPDEQRARLLAKEAVLRAGKPSLVLTPTSDTWTDELRRLMEASKAMLGSLADLVTADPDHSWVATEDWDYLLEAFERRAGFTRRAGTQNKRPPRRRGERLAKVDAIRREIVLLAETRIKTILFAEECGDTYKLERIRKGDICKYAEVEPHDFSRAAKDPAGADIYDLFQMLNNADQLRTWWKNHRSVAEICS